MMKKLLPLTALALGLSSGVALADRHGGDHRGSFEHRGPSHSTVVVRDHRGGYNGGGYNGGYRSNHNNTVVVRDHGWRGGGSRVVVHNRPNYVVRRPIFVSRPIIRDHYYNYYRRPTLIVENYGPRPGYFWVAGSWSWSGYEWIWQPGHYEPDPNYVESGYYDGY